MIGVSFLRLSATMKEIVKIKHFSRWRKDHLFSNIDQIQGTVVNRACPSFFKITSTEGRGGRTTFLRFPSAEEGGGCRLLPGRRGALLPGFLDNY